MKIDMGCESKFYIAEKTIIKDEDGLFALKVAMFDLCNVPAVAGKISKYPFTDCYIYADDGNTKIIEDRYGDRLREIPVEDMIKIVESDETGKGYRRYAPFLGMLKAFDLKQWGDIVVLHYGH